MLISLFPTPFGHFQFLEPDAGQSPKLILTLRLKVVKYKNSTVWNENTEQQNKRNMHT